MEMIAEILSRSNSPRQLDRIQQTDSLCKHLGNHFSYDKETGQTNSVGAHALFMRTIAGRVHNAGARKVRLCVRLKPWLVKPRIRIDALPLAKQQNRTE